MRDPIVEAASKNPGPVLGIFLWPGLGMLLWAGLEWLSKTHVHGVGKITSNFLYFREEVNFLGKWLMDLGLFNKEEIYNLSRSITVVDDFFLLLFQVLICVFCFIGWLSTAGGNK